MRLPLRDALATLVVAGALGVYIAWAVGWPLPGFGAVGAVALAVLVLGVVASMSAVVPGFAELLRGSRLYLVAASALGLVALAAGLWALIGDEPLALAALVAATVSLWAMSTMRHMSIRPQPRLGHR